MYTKQLLTRTALGGALAFCWGMAVQADTIDPTTFTAGLDVGESVTDSLTVTTADGTPHNVSVTINGGEDAPVIDGILAGSVVKDGTLVATGVLSITDADASDNPVGFADVASTPGDNGYGDFDLTAGIWSYTLDTSDPAAASLS